MDCIRQIYKTYKKGWLEMKRELGPADYEIQRYLDMLDETARQYEARWGIGVLPRIVTHDMAEKWQRQCDKLNDAISDGNLNEVMGLVQGTVRGYKALEDNALAMGHKPNPPDVWDAQHPESGRKYRFCKTRNDACAATEKDTVVYSLEEVVRILEKHQMVNVVKDTFPGSTVTAIKPEPFDFGRNEPDMPPEF